MAKQAKKALKKAFGADIDDNLLLPEKIGNVKISRIINTKAKAECPHCFPHGTETTNATIKKNRRSWKLNRKTKYK